jgi:hypothetical protein
MEKSGNAATDVETETKLLRLILNVEINTKMSRLILC